MPEQVLVVRLRKDGTVAWHGVGEGALHRAWDLQRRDGGLVEVQGPGFYYLGSEPKAEHWLTGRPNKAVKA